MRGGRYHRPLLETRGTNQVQRSEMHSRHSALNFMFSPIISIYLHADCHLQIVWHAMFASLGQDWKDIIHAEWVVYIQILQRRCEEDTDCAWKICGRGNREKSRTGSWLFCEHRVNSSPQFPSTWKAALWTVSRGSSSVAVYFWLLAFQKYSALSLKETNFWLGTLQLECN